MTPMRATLMSSSNFGPLSKPISCALWTITSAVPYWVANCFRAAGAMVGATALINRSNSARRDHRLALGSRWLSGAARLVA